MARPYAYATVSDVVRHLSYLRGTVTATSMPNATQVHHHLLGAADELDAALAVEGYSTPVATTSSAFTLLGQWNSIGAAMYSADAQPSGQKSKQLPFLERRWTAILEKIEGGDVNLPGAARDTTTSLPRYGTSASGPDPYFTRDLSGVL